MTLDGVQPAYLGISLGRHYYSSERLSAYCAWAAVNAPAPFGFLIGDDIYSYTLQAFSRVQEAEALARARGKGLEVATQIGRIALKKNLRAKIVHWSDLAVLPRYKALVAEAGILVERDPSFKEALWEQARVNLSQRLSSVSGDLPVPVRFWTLLEKYVIHEIAGLSAMSEDCGFPVEVYPGPDLEILKRLYDGQWPSLRELLPTVPIREFIELRID